MRRMYASMTPGRPVAYARVLVLVHGRVHVQPRVYSTDAWGSPR